jgi:tetratricopeptide (TPR) repeat protein
MTNQFDSKDGEQNVGQGKGAIGKQNNFFYRLLGRIFTTRQPVSPAIRAGRDVQAIEQLEDAAKQRRISAADTNVSQAIAQRIQLRYAKAAACWQKAAALLPEDKKQERSLCLHEAGYDLDRVGRHSEALPLYEQSLAINREIGDKKQEGVTLNNISQIYSARGDYTTALTYLEQSLVISREIGNKAGEGATLNNISGIYHARGDYSTALTYLEQSLGISREIGDKAGEGATLNNIATAAYAKGDYATALKYLKQSLIIFRETGSKAQEAVTSWNIGRMYEKQGDLRTAEPYISRAVQLAEELGHPQLEEWREALEDVRAELRSK